MKNKLADATLQPIDEAVPFIVETDASDFTIAATLNQNGKPVAFHARTLSTSENDIQLWRKKRRGDRVWLTQISNFII